MTDEGDSEGAWRVHLAQYGVIITGEWGLRMLRYTVK